MSGSPSGGDTDRFAHGGWLADAERRVRADPAAVHTVFPTVGRNVGRAPMRRDTDPDGLVYGTEDDVARTQLLVAVAEVLSSADLAAALAELYRFGDDAERRGVLRGLGSLPESVAATGLELITDALRSNDARLVAAAMGPFGGEHLDQHTWRHGVLKCLFVGVPLGAVGRLDARVDSELGRMVADYAAERTAAGRAVPEDVARLLPIRPAASH